MFKAKYDLKKRRDESSRIITKYPARVPVIVEKSHTEKVLASIDRNKFLVPATLNFANFLTVIRGRLKLSHEIALYIFVGNETLVPASKLMSSVYEELKDDDGFLYCTYASESTFGAHCDCVSTSDDAPPASHRKVDKNCRFN